MGQLLEQEEAKAIEQRQRVHLLIDVLPYEKLSAVHSLLEVLAPPLTLAQTLAMAPVEDEELSDEMIARLKEADASLDRGESVSHEEMLREFGIGAD